MLVPNGDRVDLTDGGVKLDKNEMFSAAKGKGAFLNGKPIKVSENSNLLNSLAATLSMPKRQGAQYCSLSIACISYLFTQKEERPFSVDREAHSPFSLSLRTAVTAGLTAEAAMFAIHRALEV